MADSRSQSSPWRCERVEPLLPGFLDDELPRRQLEGVRAHLRECVACRRRAVDYLQSLQALQRAAVAGVGARHDGGFAAEVDGQQLDFDAMHTDILAAVAVARDASPSPVWPMRLLMAAAAVLLAAIGFWFAGSAAVGSSWGPGGGSVWEREGTAIPISDPGVMVVPYSGGPLELVPAGIDRQMLPGRSNGAGETGGMVYGSGMSSRGFLRPEIEILPAVHVQREASK